jgi:hypothetical protein
MIVLLSKQSYLLLLRIIHQYRWTRNEANNESLELTHNDDDKNANHQINYPLDVVCWRACHTPCHTVKNDVLASYR